MATNLRSLPKTFQRLVVTKLTTDFKNAVHPITETLLKPDMNKVLVRNRFVGINASDVNMTAGRYLPDIKPPFGLGFEGIGEVVGVGENVTEIKVGQPVMYMGTNSFAEYVYLSENEAISIPSVKPEFLPLLVSGATSSLSLDKSGRIAPGEKVLITAAAGGTGHIAVQWAKYAGCHVIGLCSSNEKVNFLKELGCDRPINYKESSVEEILKKEYPDGIDVVWETVGGDLFDMLLKNLAVKGRMVVVGAISGYDKETLSSNTKTTDIPLKMLRNSSSITGFFLNHYMSDIPHYLTLLVRLMHEEKLRVLIDTGVTTKEGPFNGLADISRAVQHLHSGQNKGKVIVSL